MLISASAAAMSSSIASSGNKFAALKAASAFDSQRAKVSESLNGLTQAQFLNDLMGEPIDKITNELVFLRDHLLSGSSAFKAALIHSGADGTFPELIGNFFTNLKIEPVKESFSNVKSSSSPESQAMFVPGPFSSNFSAMSFMPFTEGRPTPRQSALLNICAKLLRSKHLHREIREKGGAYGSAASFSPLSGLFTFSSYRDPSPLNSLNVFRSAGKALLSRDAPSEEDLLGAKLSAFSDLDAPVDVSARGLQEFLYGPEMGSDVRRQEYREALLACGLKDVQETIGNVLQPLIDSSENYARVCVIGEAAKIEEFKNDQNLNWTIKE